MKKIYLMLSMAILGVMAGSCKKNEPTTPGNNSSDPAEMTLKVNFMNGNTPYTLGQEAVSTSEQHFMLNKLNFYMGDIKLIKNDNSTVDVKDVVLVTATPDDKADLTWTNTTFTFKGLPAGDYKGISFGVGVPPALDGMDAKPTNDYDIAHPLSARRGMVWTWDNTFRYVVLEGTGMRVPAASAEDSSILRYHVRTEQAYDKVELLKPINLKAGSNELNLAVQVEKFFNNGQESIDIIHDSGTDMSEGDADKVALGMKVISNFRQSLMLQ